MKKLKKNVMIKIDIFKVEGVLLMSLFRNSQS